MGLIILKNFFLWSWFILGGVAAGVIFADIYRDHFNENIALPSLVIFTLVGAFLAYKATIKRGSSNWLKHKYVELSALAYRFIFFYLLLT